MPELRKRRPGEPMVIPASDWNAAMDATRHFLNHRNGFGREGEGRDTDTGIVLVKNTSGSDVDRFGVLGIDTILFTPTENLEGFKNRAVLKGVEPEASHTGRFVIAAAPIADNSIGPCHIQGVCPVLIETADATVPTAADVKVGSLTQLIASSSGNAQVLYREAGSGVKWALVRLGGGAAAGDIPVRITANAVLKSVNATVGGGASVSVEIMWTYSAVEIESFNPTTQAMVDKSGGLEFSASGAGGLPKLYNICEWAHDDTYAWGINYAQANYPTGNRPRPVGGGHTSNTHKYNRPVLVRTFLDNSGNVIYIMDEVGSHDGACS